MKVRKAVITAGGWGTRFLPLTRSQPKEMLPIVNKPLIHYAVEEAINSGIEQIIMVTALGKNAIEDYFDRSFELEYFLEQKGEARLLSEMRELSNLINICYIRQKEQLGLGHAVAATRDVVGDEPFAVILPDDIIYGPIPVLRQMLDVYEKFGDGVIAVEEIAPADSVKYGVIEPCPVGERTYEIQRLVEKPAPEVAPSNLGIVGRYILPPEIFEAIATTKPGVKGEIQITDALQQLLDGQKLYACQFTGERHDAGNPLGWLKATVTFALGHPEIGPVFRNYLRENLE